MRLPIALTTAITLAVTSLSALEIKDVSNRFFEKDEFKRISEYFTGKENQGRRVILRTSEERNGYYFIVTLDESIKKLTPGSIIKIDAYAEGSPDPTSFEFTIPTPKHTGREIFIGLTGGEKWPDEAQAIAYKITIADAQGNPLAVKESFLWQE